MGRRCIAPLTCLGATFAAMLAVACSVPPLDEVGKSCTGDRCPSGLPCVQGTCAANDDAGANDATTDTTSSDADTGVTCTPPGGGDPCTSIPMLAGAQVVDCRPDEFCNVPVLTFLADADGDASVPATFQVAWSDAGLHVYVRVRKWPVVPAAGDNGVYAGDAIELFTASSSADLTGSQDDDAIHLAVSPPATAAMPGGRATYFVANVGTYNGMSTFPVPMGTSLGCIVADAGYDIEFEVPWHAPWLSPQPTSVPSAGQMAGFNFALDVPSVDDAGFKQTFEHLAPIPEGGATDNCVSFGVMEAPFCDDRCSCAPMLR